jgi:uracil-DNA glycosylase
MRIHDIPADVTIENGASVWPGRRGDQHDDAPEGSHICRAFEGLEPEDVRVVILGEDPYAEMVYHRFFTPGFGSSGDEI